MHVIIVVCHHPLLWCLNASLFIHIWHIILQETRGGRYTCSLVCRPIQSRGEMTWYPLFAHEQKPHESWGIGYLRALLLYFASCYCALTYIQVVFLCQHLSQVATF